MTTIDFFHNTGVTTYLDYADSELAKMPCGLHRAPFAEAASLMPELGQLFDSAPMYLWISGHPETQALDIDQLRTVAEVTNHSTLREAIAHLPRKPLESQRWYSFSQLSPHAGSMATKNCWRIFCRLTHESIAPYRPVESVIRRHAQVYLDANEFAW